MSAHFVTPVLRTERYIGQKKFHLYEPLTFYSEILGREVVAPIGFETDFASIPRLLRGLIQVNGPHIHAAVIHDYLCVYGKEEGITQKQADQVFYEAMEVLEVKSIQRNVMYRGVRIYQSIKGIFK